MLRQAIYFKPKINTYKIIKFICNDIKIYTINIYCNNFTKIGKINVLTPFIDHQFIYTTSLDR